MSDSPKKLEYHISMKDSIIKQIYYDRLGQEGQIPLSQEYFKFEKQVNNAIKNLQKNMTADMRQSFTT